MIPRSREGYLRVEEIQVEDFLAIHQEAAAHGPTWDLGVREVGSLYHLVDTLHAMARSREAPEAIAAECLLALVRQHPFWDANHRTAFDAAQVILSMFEREVSAPAADVERFVRSLDEGTVNAVRIAAWILERAVPLDRLR